MRIIGHLLYVVTFLNLSFLYGQNIEQVLTHDQYILDVIEFHPLAIKAGLREKAAEIAWLQAKGNLDPEISSSWNQKNFDKKNYYQIYDAKVSIPIRFGLDFIAGYDNTRGVFLNPENKTDAFGLWNAGLELNVLQGLLVNERTTALDQAKLFSVIAENEKRMLINDLIYSASEAYLYWQEYFYYDQILQENSLLAQTYLENTKESYLGGEKTRLDTIEAFALYQDAIFSYQRNKVELIKSIQYLENFLWFEGQAIELKNTTIPEDFNNRMFSSQELLADPNILNLPEAMVYVNKLNSLEIEEKLKKEKLKPKLKLKYNPLLATNNNSISPNFSPNDYKWGFGFSMPLLLRSERAGLQETRLKIQETELDLESKQNELRNKLQTVYMNYFAMEDQIKLIQDNLEAFQLLLEGESEKFKFGESSVFLLNKRQEKYISTRIKVVKTVLKQKYLLLQYLHLSNRLIN